VRAEVDTRASNMTEAVAGKTCTLHRGGIPPLTREQAELFHAQAPDRQPAEGKLTTSGGASGFAVSATLTFLPNIRELTRV
jgi:4a-hydroxytetrahydrobiopterin dehydratase